MRVRKPPSLWRADMRTPHGRDRRLGRCPCWGRRGRHPSRRERSWYRSTARRIGCRARRLRIGEPPLFGTGCSSLPGCAGSPTSSRGEPLGDAPFSRQLFARRVRAANAVVCPRPRQSVAGLSTCRSSDGSPRASRLRSRRSTHSASCATYPTVGSHPGEWRAARCGSRATSPRE